MVEDQRVLSDPAQAGGRGELALQQRSRVHAGPSLEGIRDLRMQSVREGAQSGPHDGVIILTPCVHGDLAGHRRADIAPERRFGLAILPRHDDDASRARQKLAGIEA
jgi:hypothetical protein